MTKRQVFYSFHYDNDVWRVQQVRQMGVIEGNPSVSPNEWEQLKRSGDSAIERWIDANMKYRSCVIVLIGSETASRKWVKYEIEKAWNEGKGLMGIYIHNLKDRYGLICKQGPNPFKAFTLNNSGQNLSEVVPCYNPSSLDAYNNIKNNIDSWIEHAIAIRKSYK